MPKYQKGEQGHATTSKMMRAQYLVPGDHVVMREKGRVWTWTVLAVDKNHTASGVYIRVAMSNGSCERIKDYRPGIVFHVRTDMTDRNNPTLNWNNDYHSGITTERQ